MKKQNSKLNSIDARDRKTIASVSFIYVQTIFDYGD